MYSNVVVEVVPEKWHYEFFQHTMEGPDDMTGHLKCSMLGCSATLTAKILINLQLL